jgi:hypothetical protein
VHHDITYNFFIASLICCEERLRLLTGGDGISGLVGQCVRLIIVCPGPITEPTARETVFSRSERGIRIHN